MIAVDQQRDCGKGQQNCHPFDCQKRISCGGPLGL
jgi:hypothetical protein